MNGMQELKKEFENIKNIRWFRKRKNLYNDLHKKVIDKIDELKKDKLQKINEIYNLNEQVNSTTIRKINIEINKIDTEIIDYSNFLNTISLEYSKTDSRISFYRDIFFFIMSIIMSIIISKQFSLGKSYFENKFPDNIQINELYNNNKTKLEKISNSIIDNRKTLNKLSITIDSLEIYLQKELDKKENKKCK